MQNYDPEQVESDYQKYLDELSGEATRRRMARQLTEEAVEREEELRRHSEETGSPMPENYR